MLQSQNLKPKARCKTISRCKKVYVGTTIKRQNDVNT